MPSSSFIEWVETFRSWTAEELAAHIVSLKGQLSIFSSQGVGSKSFTRDLAELRTQLSAATRAMTEKNQTNVGSSGVTDFSCVNPESAIGGSLPEVPTSF